MSIQNQCKQMDIVIKRLKDMELYVLSDVVDYAKGNLISLSAELEEYQKATELSGKVNSKLIQELLDKPAVAVPDGLEIAAKHLEQKAKDYAKEHGYQEPDTGAWVFPGNGQDYLYWCEETAEEMRALAAPSHSQQSAGQIPECFKRLTNHAVGMCFGVDWNRGVAATLHRQKLIDTAWECDKYLSGVKHEG